MLMSFFKNMTNTECNPKDKTIKLKTFIRLLISIFSPYANKITITIYIKGIFLLR